jgi:2'-5' RNA ligase
VSLVVVAIPAENDYVWKISSEKVPHCTLLFLGEDALKVKNLSKIREFVEHAVNVWDRGPFGLSVDYRGELGDDKADVLFFRQDWSTKKLAEFRGLLLQEPNIKTAYDSSEQFDGWTPHLTLGYPETPAKEDKRDYPGIQWVEFDRIALWYGDSEGAEFRLEYKYDYDLAEVGMDATTVAAGREFISHFGVKGMKWGVRKAGSSIQSARTRRKDQKFEKGMRVSTVVKSARKASKLTMEKDYDRINNDPRWKGKDLSDPKNKALAKQHDEEYKKAFIANLRTTVGEQRNASGTREHYVTVDKHGIWDIRTRNVRHADSTGVRVRPVRNSKGFIIDLEILESDMAQTAMDLGEAFVIEHYGVKGMRWGVRKQRDVSTQTVIDSGLRRKTKVKAKGGEAHPATDDAIKAAVQRQKLKKSGAAALSNQELRELATRMQLEQQVKSLDAQSKSSGKKLVKSLLREEGEGAARRGAKAGKKAAARKVAGAAASLA